MSVHRLTMNILIAMAFVRGSTLAQERETEKFPLDFWNNWLTPDEYRQQIDYVQHRMKSEFQVENRYKHPLRETDATSKWTGIGPSRVVRADPNFSFFGRIRVIHPYYNTLRSDWEWYCGASSGGLWFGDHYSSPPNTNWISLGDNLENPSVGAFAIKPDDPNTIFVGTGDYNRFTGSGLYKTTNRGNTWIILPLRSGASTIVPGAITDLFYKPNDPNVLWLSSSSGVYKSVDAGSTWNSTTPTSWGVWDMVIDQAHPETLFVARTGGNGVWRTTDGGGVWVPRNFGLAADVGSSTALDISLSNPSVLYAALTDSTNSIRGIFKTTNSGGTWEETTYPGKYIDGQGFHTNVIRVDPTDPNIVYAGANEFRRTTDGGSTWQAPPAAHGDYTSFEFFPGQPKLVMEGDDGGIAMMDFTASSVPAVDNHLFRFIPSSPLQSYGFDDAISATTIMASGNQDNGTIYTAMAGTYNAEWNLVGGCDGGNEINIDPADPALLYYMEWCGGAFHRYRQYVGGSKTNINDGLEELNMTPIRLCKYNAPNYLFTVTGSDIYYSTDQGNSWQRIDGDGYDFATFEQPPRGIAVGGSGTNVVCYVWFYGSPRSVKVFEGTPGSMTSSYRNIPGYPLVGQSTSQFNSGVSVDRRFAGATAYAFENTAPYRVYKTTNTGALWLDISGTDAGGLLPGVRKHDVVSSPSSPSTLYAATDIGVFKSTNNGATWYTYQWGLPRVPVTNLAYIDGTSGDPDTLRIGTYGHGMWQRVLTGDDPLPVYYKFSTAVRGLDLAGRYGFAVGKNGLIARTSDSGKMWTGASSPTNATLNAVRMNDSLHGLAVGDLGTIVSTTDGGGTWSVMSSGTSENLLDVASTSPQDAYAAGEGGTLLRTTDGGQSWQSPMNGSNRKFHSIFFASPLEGWISGTDFSGQIPLVLLLITSDGGQNWNPPQASVGPGGGCDVMFPDPLNGYLTLEGGGILRSSDGGQNWSPQQTGTQSDLHSVFFLNPDDGWACGDGGAFIHTSTGGQLWLATESGADSSLFAIAYSGGSVFAAGIEGIFKTKTESVTTIIHPFSEGWNLLSLPVTALSSSVKGIYPSAVSPAFMYQGSYSPATDVSPGEGYWIKFGSGGIVGSAGASLSNLAIPVQPRWNLVGSLSSAVSVSDITSEPPGIRTSNFYRYDGTYSVADSLRPGDGYWVKANQTGTLFLSTSGPASAVNRITIVPDGESPPAPPDRNIDELSRTAKAFALEQNYPNPFNPATAIRYRIPEDARVTLKIYDLLGRQILVLVDRIEPAGEKIVTFDAHTLPSGVYYYKLVAGARSGIKKMLVIK